jgi:hypothetical protein
VGAAQSRTRLAELLGEVQQRVEHIVDSTCGRMDALLAVSSGLELGGVARTEGLVR